MHRQRTRGLPGNRHRAGVATKASDVAGHKRMATCLAQSITGQRLSLDNVPVPANPLEHTLKLLSDGKPVRVLAMAPGDEWIAPTLRSLYPKAEITVDAWPTANLKLAEIEAAAKAKVRSLKPDLVLIAVPRSAGADSDEAFANSYAWIMNWSLNFGPPTWDTVVVHPSVIETTSASTERDDLIRRLVHAQDLSLIDRPGGNTSTAQEIVLKWFQQFAARP